MCVIQTRGLNAWVVYTLVGLLLALMAHRRESDHQMEKYSPSLQFPFFVKYHQYHHQNENTHFLTLCFSPHREGLPLTMKSCFYPLIGDRIFGWPGDLVDMIRFR